VEAYKVRLHVLSKSVRVRRGREAHIVRSGNETRYLVGSSEQAFLHCGHRALLPEHCWVVVGPKGVVITPASPDAELLLNDQPISTKVSITSGDVLQIGPLELELLVSAASSVAGAKPAAPAALPTAQFQDPVDREISDWLMDEDNQERDQRLQDPDLRKLELDSSARLELEGAERRRKKKGASESAEKKPAKKTGKLPVKPTPQPAPNTTDAAQGALKQIFTRPKAE
jgi:hypothetical protein